MWGPTINGPWKHFKAVKRINAIKQGCSVFEIYNWTACSHGMQLFMFSQHLMPCYMSTYKHRVLSTYPKYSVSVWVNSCNVTKVTLNFIFWGKMIFHLKSPAPGLLITIQHHHFFLYCSVMRTWRFCSSITSNASAVQPPFIFLFFVLIANYNQAKHYRHQPVKYETTFSCVLP